MIPKIICFIFGHERRKWIIEEWIYHEVGFVPHNKWEEKGRWVDLKNCLRCGVLFRKKI